MDIVCSTANACVVHLLERDEGLAMIPRVQHQNAEKSKTVTSGPSYWTCKHSKDLIVFSMTHSSRDVREAKVPITVRRWLFDVGAWNSQPTYWSVPPVTVCGDNNSPGPGLTAAAMFR